MGRDPDDRSVRGPESSPPRMAASISPALAYRCEGSGLQGSFDDVHEGRRACRAARLPAALARDVRAPPQLVPRGGAAPEICARRGRTAARRGRRCPSFGMLRRPFTSSGARYNRRSGPRRRRVTHPGARRLRSPSGSGGRRSCGASRSAPSRRDERCPRCAPPPAPGTGPVPKHSASLALRGPSRWIASCSVEPSMKSIQKPSRPPCTSAPCTITTLRWRTRTSMRASCSMLRPVARCWPSAASRPRRGPATDRARGTLRQTCPHRPS